MSQHIRHLSSTRTLRFGWDYIEGGSFFFSITDEDVVTEQNESGFIAEVGGTTFFPDFKQEQILDVNELASRLASFGIELTAGELAQLEADKLARGSKLTPLQTRVKRHQDAGTFIQFLKGEVQ